MNLDRRACVRGLALAAMAGVSRARAQAAAPQAGAAPAGPVIDAARGEQPAPAIGTRIELPTAILLDGSTLAPASWDGKVLVAVLWASWCPFCARTLPMIDALHRRERARGLEVLGLNIDRRPADAVAYMQRRGYGFPSARFDADWRRVLGKPKGLPIVWVVGRGGRLEHVARGEMFQEDVDELSQWLKA